jgi:hypothetical protein
VSLSILNSRALMATMIVLADINTAPTEPFAEVRSHVRVMVRVV